MRAARLRRDADIEAVRRLGASRQDRLFAVRAQPNTLGEIRLAVSAPRALGRAVARNRARRRVREAFRQVIKEARDARGHDLLVTARAPAGRANPEALRDAAAAAIAWLAQA